MLDKAQQWFPYLGTSFRMLVQAAAWVVDSWSRKLNDTGSDGNAKELADLSLAIEEGKNNQCVACYLFVLSHPIMYAFLWDETFLA